MASQTTLGEGGLLESDLEYCLMQRDSAQARVDHWNQLASHVKTMRSQPSTHRNHLLVDMGENYHLEAKTDNNEEMFVHAGLSFYVPMPIHNNNNNHSQNSNNKNSSDQSTTTFIDQFIEKQVDQWTERVTYWQKRAENDKNVILLSKYVTDLLTSSSNDME